MPVPLPPSLPSTAARLLSLCADDQFSLAEMVRIIEADPPISSRVLHLANSAYFGLPRQVDTLTSAVQLLGKMTVQALALGHSLLGFWKGRTPPPAAEGLWSHAYLCALGCRHLAERLPRSSNLSSSDTLFLTGLLHDIGKILFLVQTPEAYCSALLRWSETQSLLAWERETFGNDHAEAGGAALESWNLPFPITAVVRYHHRQGLRAELQSDWHVLRAVDDLAAGVTPRGSETPLPGELLSDLAGRMDGFAEEAKAFYEVVR